MGSMGQVALDCQGEKLAELANCSYFAVGRFERGLARNAARTAGSPGSERAAGSYRFTRNGASQAGGGAPAPSLSPQTGPPRAVSPPACKPPSRSIPSWSSVVAFLFFGVFI